MPEDEPQNTVPETRTSRRKTLKALGAGSASIAGAGLFAAPTGASRSDDTVTITTVKVGDEPRVRKEVPADWWEYEERAERVKAQLQSQYRDDPAIEGVGLATTNEVISDRNKSSVTVQVAPEKSTNANIPSAVGDVPVEVVDALRPEPDTCYTGDYDPVPGGVQVGDGTGVVASATCPVTDSGGQEMLMTCGHLWDDCNEDITGNGLYQSGQYVGTVADNSVKQDWATINLDLYSEVGGFDNTIVDTYAPLSGRVTYDGLKDLKSNGTTVYKKGRTSCKTSGLVKQLDVAVGRCSCSSGCNYSSNNFVKTSTPTDGGDSGSPHYHEYYFNSDKYLAVIAPHHGGESVGCGAYAIHNAHGYEFQI